MTKKKVSKEKEAIAKLEKEIKNSKGYGSPGCDPNLGMRLIYGFEGLCVLADEAGHAYYVKQTLNGFVLEKLRVV